MNNCANCGHVLPPIHGHGIGMRFCGVKCCRAYHSPDIDRRIRDDGQPPFTATKSEHQHQHTRSDFIRAEGR